MGAWGLKHADCSRARLSIGMAGRLSLKKLYSSAQLSQPDRTADLHLDHFVWVLRIYISEEIVYHLIRLFGNKSMVRETVYP